MLRNMLRIPKHSYDSSKGIPMNSNKLLTEFDHDFSIMIQYMGRYVIDLLFNLGYFIYEK